MVPLILAHLNVPLILAHLNTYSIEYFDYLLIYLSKYLNQETVK